MKTYLVDAFTREPFKGNPAGVCFPEQDLSAEKMLDIAREFGLSETAFVKATSKAGTYTIRYFSPKKEIPLCGHATLASAKIIFNDTHLNEIHFITSEQIDLSVKKQEAEIVMEFPVYELTDATVPAAMLSALGLLEVEVVSTTYSPNNKILMLEISDDHRLSQLSPDFAALLSSHENINGVLVTAPSTDEKYDFHYRYFWPWAGTNEDPVTGGVQTFLAKYWAEKLGKQKMSAFQSSSRTGQMRVEVQQDKVLIIGQAVIVLAGNLLA